ncbi:BnaC01g36960D [Brassica napus]|uniref:BnaC01g36960D protein n=2 Tax=Brassica TaxID=3705 RepID=A0A078H8P7_BRANA|nr:BnaC01g36960D [Brassica napus]VDD52577.1 unnamed protein product [Brassica oleracea]
MPTAQSETHKDLTYKLWPQGNITFRETSDPEGGSWKPGNRISVSCHIPVRTMIMESFEEQPGLNPHIDSHFLTILCQNDVVDGVEIKAKDGEDWIKAKPSQGSSFLVIAGASLHLLLNGRVFPPFHRVVITGKKDRHVAGLFVLPKEGLFINALEEMVDDEAF